MHCMTPLSTAFFAPSAWIVAPRLLGHFLLRRTPDGAWAGGEIVETEAYLANDPACHGFRGETVRNRSMFGPPDAPTFISSTAITSAVTPCVLRKAAVKPS